LKFDLGKAGLETVLSPWQAEVMRYVWEVGETDSRRAHEHLQGTEHGKSRAAVIFFLNGMVDEGFLSYDEMTGKGGYKGIWSPHPGAKDEDAFRQRVEERVLGKLSEFKGRAEA
jgi:predicted transcriptional regulator